MYGLHQSGRLECIKPIKHLVSNGYITTSHTPGLFLHITLPTTFNLVVDNFWFKVIWQTHANHLINSPKKNYDVTIYRDGKIFCGIHLKWDCRKITVDIYIPKYFNKSLAWLQHTSPKKPQHSPHPYTTHIYIQKQKYAKTTRNACQLTPAQVKFCQ